MSIAHRLGEFALRALPPRTMKGLRERYFALRRNLASVERLVYGTFDTPELRAHLEERVGHDFQVLMVHSSMNRLATAYSGNPLELVRMLMDFVGPTRTLAMPAFYFGDPRIGNVHDTFRQNPVCNLRRTPSQMGLATELFRRSKGVLQSRHPAYRVAAIGPLAGPLTSGHERCEAAAGIGSPFEFMAAHDTLVLGIGKSFHVMTQVHHVEAVMGDEFPVPRTALREHEATEVTVVDGEEQVRVSLPVGGDVAWRFNIDKLPSLLEHGELSRWRFHNVPMFAARAGPVTRSLMEAARAGRTLFDKP